MKTGSCQVRRAADLGHGADQPDPGDAHGVRGIDVQNRRHRDARDDVRAQLPAGRYRRGTGRRDLCRGLVRHPNGSHRSPRHVGQVVRTDLAAAGRSLRAGGVVQSPAAHQSAARRAARRQQEVVSRSRPAVAWRAAGSLARTTTAPAGTREPRPAGARGALDGEPDLRDRCHMGTRDARSSRRARSILDAAAVELRGSHRSTGP